MPVGKITVAGRVAERHSVRVNLKRVGPRTWPFRCLGYVCLALLAAGSLGGGVPADVQIDAQIHPQIHPRIHPQINVPLEGQTTPEHYLLLLFALGWPWLTWRILASGGPHAALVLHVVESFVLGVLLCALSGLAAVAVALAVLAGPAALGGLVFLAPSAIALALGLACSGEWSLPGWDTAISLLLLFVFTLGLALVSYRQAARLHTGRDTARTESQLLRRTNNRLSRYLPGAVLDDLRANDLAEQAPTERWITVVFVDLVGFTELMRNRSPAEMAQVVNDYQSALSELVVNHGGVLGKFLGDGALIYFPERSSRLADALGCLRLCLALPAMLDTLAHQWRQLGQLLQLRHRAGVASGYCAIGDWGGERLDHTVFGDAVNLASRLQAAAEEGGTLTCEATSTLVGVATGSPVRLDGPISIALKGVGTVAAYRLVDVASGPL